MSKAHIEKSKSPTRLFLEDEIAKIHQRLDIIEANQQPSQALVDAVLDGVRQLLPVNPPAAEQEESENAENASALREQIDELVSQRDSALDSAAKLQTENERLESELLLAAEDAAKLHAENKRLESELLLAAKDGAKLQTEVADLTAQQQSLKEEVGRLQSEIENLTEQYEILLQKKEDEMCRILSRLKWALFGKDDPTTVEELEQEIERLKSSLTEECEKSEELASQNGLQSEEISSLKQQAEDASQQIAELTAAVADRESQIEARDETIADMRAKISERDDKISDMEKQLTDLNDAVSSKSAEITALNDEITSLKNDIGLANAENSRLSGAVDSHEKCRNEFNEAIAPFLAIFMQMQKCPSMQELLAGQFGLPVTGGLNIAQQVQFANCFSDRTYCAAVVYDAMKEYKKAKPEPLTEDERKLVSMLNDYYKNLFGIGEDILDCLSIESGSVFNINEMRLVTDPTVTWLSQVNYLCVPALRNQDSLSELAQKALIMGE